nr:integrase, catalytic region, zinc finger, CCHC-type, peptidase aspartic, catalytic [Tanacetum cinerariifolium]
MMLSKEAVATACYTQNRSLIHTRHHKTPYELVHNKKPDLTFFRVFGALCYPTNDSKDFESFNQQLTLGYLLVMLQAGKGPAPNFLTPGQISSGLVPNHVPATPYAPPPALQSHSLPPGVVAEPHFMEDYNVAPVDSNPFVNVFAPEPHSEASSLGDISSTESPLVKILSK